MRLGLFAVLLAWAQVGGAKRVKFMEDDWTECIPNSILGYAGYTAGKGRLRVYARPAVLERVRKKATLPIATSHGEWCPPWNGRSCGFSHAYTHSLPNSSAFPKAPVLPVSHLPHRGGGIQASFEGWNVINVARGAGGPSRAVLADIIGAVQLSVSESEWDGMTLRELDNPLQDCARTLPRAILLPLNLVSWADTNVGHFLADLIHPFHRLGALYGAERGQPSSPFIYFPQNNTKRLGKFPRHAGLPQDMVERLLGGVVASGTLGEGRTCVKDLVVDCPEPGSLRGYAALRHSMSSLFGWDFRTLHRPLPGETHARMVLLLRSPSGSRVVQNPQFVVDGARRAGWCVSVLRTDLGRHTDILSALQQAHGLAALHGTELAQMLFLRKGGVVVEAVPELYAARDGFFAEQARAGGHPLLRYHIPSSRVHYWGDPVFCKRMSARCECIAAYDREEIEPKPNQTSWPVHRLRGTRSFVAFDEEWVRVAEMALAALPWKA
eukprot:Hpha_TRINITY_DN9690_c0_g4::TRINITY_DN9690_c0_g4_i1::g.184285::m.184285